MTAHQKWCAISLRRSARGCPAVPSQGRLDHIIAQQAADLEQPVAFGGLRGEPVEDVGYGEVGGGGSLVRPSLGLLKPMMCKPAGFRPLPGFGLRQMNAVGPGVKSAGAPSAAHLC